MLHSKLVQHAHFANSVPAEPALVWRQFGNMLHLEMVEATSMPASVHLLLFLLRGLVFHANHRDLIFSALDPRQPLIPAIGQTLQQLLVSRLRLAVAADMDRHAVEGGAGVIQEDEPGKFEYQGWVDELVEACNAVFTNVDFSFAQLQVCQQVVSFSAQRMYRSCAC